MGRRSEWGSAIARARARGPSRATGAPSGARGIRRRERGARGVAGRSDGLLILRALGLVLALPLLGLGDALAETPRQLGELLRPEQEQDDDQDDHQLLVAETEHGGPPSAMWPLPYAAGVRVSIERRFGGPFGGGRCPPPIPPPRLRGPSPRS